MRIEISGVDLTTYYAQKTLSIEDAINDRSTAHFKMIDETGALDLKDGQPIKIYDNDNTLIFGGFLFFPKRFVPIATSAVIYDIEAIDNHAISDRFIVAEAFTDTLAGDIVKTLRTNYLNADDITIGDIQDGPLVEAISYARVGSVSDAMDELAEISGFSWWIDHDKKLYFVQRNTFTAPFGLTDTAPIRSVNLREDKSRYRNTQYIRGGLDRTQEIVKEKPTPSPDGVSKTFITRFPIATKPRIFISASALSFDGVDDYVSIPKVLPDDGTIEIWYYPTSFYNYNTIWDNSIDPNQWECWIYADGLLAAKSGGANLLFDLKTLGGVNEWYQIAFTWNKVGNTNLYVNGILRATQPTTWVTPGTNFYLSGGHAGNSGGTGTSDDLRIWNVARTQAEIQANMNKELIGNETGLAGYWKFNEGSGTTAIDSTANGNDGTINGATYVTEDLWGVEVSPDDIGVNGFDTNKKYYFTYNTNNITQDDSETVLSTEVLEITYIGLYPLLVVAQSADAINDRKSIEGGTGIYENIANEPKIDQRENALTIANSKLRKYTKIEREITYQTFTNGLKTGQLQNVNMDKYKVENGEFLIDRMTITDFDGTGMLLYDVHCVDGEAFGGWTTFFKQLVKEAGKLIIREDEVLVILQLSFETQGWGEDTQKIVFSLPIPSETLYPSETFYPGEGE